MWEVAGEQERLAASPLDGKSEARIVAVKTDEDPPLFNLLLEILACFGPGLRTHNRLSLKIQLYVPLVKRPVEPVHEERDPGRSSFEKTNSKIRKAVEQSMANHGGRL